MLLNSWAVTCTSRMHRVGQNRIYTPYMTVYLVISLPKIPYIHRIYMVLNSWAVTCTLRMHVTDRPAGSVLCDMLFNKVRALPPFY
jgi:hypothetical protein